jgi:hypothetical protein
MHRVIATPTFTPILTPWDLLAALQITRLRPRLPLGTLEEWFLPVPDPDALRAFVARLSGLRGPGIQISMILGEVEMAEIRLDANELRPVVQEVVAAVLQEFEGRRTLLNGKLAVPEGEAAQVL